ncbi:Hypothetical protein MVR_LOCUS398 [uncultured virus]|nr:Hypothetical protein MVR_LOCUS398 [uncultured virus]
MFKRIAFPISHFAKTAACKFSVTSRMSMPAVMQCRNFGMKSDQIDDAKTTFKCDAMCTSPCKLKTEASTNETIKLETTKQVAPRKQSTSDRYTTLWNPTIRQWLDTASSWYEFVPYPRDRSAYGIYLTLAKRFHNGIIRSYQCIGKISIATDLANEEDKVHELPLKFQDRILSREQFEAMLDLKNIISTICIIARFVGRYSVMGSLYLILAAYSTTILLGRICAIGIPLLLFIGACVLIPWIMIPGIIIALLLSLY